MIMDKIVEIDVELIAVTDMAVFVDEGKEDPVWIPKSQTQNEDIDEMQIGDTFTLEIPEWLALEKELI
jgi:hypothetical protein